MLCIKKTCRQAENHAFFLHISNFTALLHPLKSIFIIFENWFWYWSSVFQYASFRTSHDYIYYNFITGDYKLWRHKKYTNLNKKNKNSFKSHGKGLSTAPRIKNFILKNRRTLIYIIQCPAYAYNVVCILNQKQGKTLSIVHRSEELCYNSRTFLSYMKPTRG